MINAPAISLRSDLRPRVSLNPAAHLAWIARPANTLVLLCLAFPFAAMAGRPLYGDIFWMLAYGRHMFDLGGLPAADPFSFAPHSESYFHIQWLSHLMVAAVERVAGLEGVMVFNAAIGALTFGLLLHIAYVRTRSLAVAVAATLLAELQAVAFLYPRAQTMSMLPFAATWWLLTCGGNRRRTLAGLAVLQMAWSNWHGSFFLGPLMTGMVLAGVVGDALIRDASCWRTLARDRRVRFLTIAIVVQLAATLVNPYGLGLYMYLSNMSSDPIVRGWVTEWFPVSIGEYGGPAFFLSVGSILVVLGLAGWRIAVVDALIILVFAYLGLSANRNIPWWALVCGPMLATYAVRIAVPANVAALRQHFAIRQPRLKSGLIRFGLVSAFVAASLPWIKPHVVILPADVRTIVDDTYPIAAGEFLLANDFGPRVFNWQAWGAYVDWRLWPRYEPFLDSAIEVHPTEVWQEARLIARGHVRMEELLDKHAIDVLLLQNIPGDAMLQALDRGAQWTRVYEDDIAIVYVRAEEAAS